ncbi:MAG: hypothetical protein IT480_15335 [Gammaproteobacteria bacterium]|nr:hypothetical protein [Gammaproteobacteria bacterium]
MRIEATIAQEHAWSASVLETTVVEPQWRVWEYPEPEIVLGCSQRALRDAALQRVAGSLPVSVRPSGGGAVLAGPWMLGVTVVLPPGHRLAGPGLVGSYRWLGRLHAEVLRASGVEACAFDPQALSAPDRAAVAADRGPPAEAGRAAPPGPAGTPVKWACFGSLAPWEVLAADGRKLTGLAQQRKRSGVAYSAGTLVARPDWALLCDAIGAPEDAPRLDALTSNCLDAAREQTRLVVLRARLATRLDTALEAALASGG